MKLVVGNWKMNGNADDARRLALTIRNDLGDPVNDCVGDHVSVAICPPFPYLSIVHEILRGSRVSVGAQNLFPENNGAFTGEVSSTMLLDLGCKYVILGHSERRKILGESDEFINQKIKSALAAGLDVIFCIGETLEERSAHRTQAVLHRELTRGLAGLSPHVLSHLSIAYEPIWAIGHSGHQATPEQVDTTHTLIRKCFSQMFGKEAADSLIIQYGGSVTPKNAVSLLSTPGVNGALVGGASLNAEEFLSIIHEASHLGDEEKLPEGNAA
jgi:triosephosphate isomerase